MSKDMAKPYCMHCKTEIHHDHYVKKNGSYCCEKCYFRDRFLEKVFDNMEGTYLATIEAFVDAIDAREHEVGNHSHRVTQFALILAKKMGIIERGLVDVYCGSMLHDLGKIGIPDAILHKHGRLSKKEHAVMSRHPEIGYKIISHIGYLSKAAEIIYSHHEHYNGTGYPRGLKGNKIPLGARIFSVCDTLDALTVSRPYRKAIPFEKAKGKILSASGNLLDPNVIEGFLNAEEDIKEFVSKIVF
jgi:HD-GYP domain-containing protein (c-di-GMP phosphodiesterase class II)